MAQYAAADYARNPGKVTAGTGREAPGDGTDRNPRRAELPQGGPASALADVDPDRGQRDQRDAERDDEPRMGS